MIEILHETGIGYSRYALLLDGGTLCDSANRFYNPFDYSLSTFDLRNNVTLFTSATRAYVNKKIVPGLKRRFGVYVEKEYDGDDPSVISTYESVAVFEKKYSLLRKLTLKYRTHTGDIFFSVRGTRESCSVYDGKGANIALIENDPSFSQKPTPYSGMDGQIAFRGDFLFDARYTVTIGEGYDMYLPHIFHAFQAMD
jgi:hypothetical protein